MTAWFVAVLIRLASGLLLGCFWGFPGAAVGASGVARGPEGSITNWKVLLRAHMEGTSLLNRKEEWKMSVRVMPQYVLTGGFSSEVHVHSASEQGE
eukprot:15256093-Alexandrium_andersonii.AAC.1